MEDQIAVNGRLWQIERFLGKGKGGYSYLVADGANRYVVKQLHHEPCDYYQFGDKLAAELDAYERLRKLNVPMPELLEVDCQAERLRKQYIDGPTVAELAQRGENLEPWLAQIRAHCPKGDFYTALTQDGGEDAQAFLADLQELRFLAPDMSVHRLLWHLYNRWNMLGVFGAMEDGEARRERLIALYEHAAECDGEVVRPKEPNWTAWANEIRLMCVQDGRTHKQICEMYSRVSRDPFWCRNVLSPSKLREKWDELSLRLSPSVSTHTEKREDPYFKASYDNVDYSQIPAGFRG